MKQFLFISLVILLDVLGCGPSRHEEEEALLGSEPTRSGADS